MPTCHSSKNGQHVLCVKVELERNNNLAKHITEKVSLHELQFLKKIIKISDTNVQDCEDRLVIVLN